MVIGCKNCGGYFTQRELDHRKAPPHNWQLTPVGERILAENNASGRPAVPCPTCGHNTLRDATATAVSR